MNPKFRVSHLATKSCGLLLLFKSHYVLFSLEKTVLIFFEPRLVLIRPYKDQSIVAWEQVQPLLELLFERLELRMHDLDFPRHKKR